MNGAATRLRLPASIPDARPVQAGRHRLGTHSVPDVAEISGLWYAQPMNLFRFLTGNARETSKLVAAVDKPLIERAFLRRAKEIESLRKHDRGEKTIHAPDIRTLVRGVR